MFCVKLNWILSALHICFITAYHYVICVQVMTMILYDQLMS